MSYRCRERWSVLLNVPVIFVHFDFFVSMFCQLLRKGLLNLYYCGLLCYSNYLCETWIHGLGNFVIGCIPICDCFCLPDRLAFYRYEMFLFCHWSYLFVLKSTLSDTPTFLYLLFMWSFVSPSLYFLSLYVFIFSLLIADNIQFGFAFYFDNYGLLIREFHPFNIYCNYWWCCLQSFYCWFSVFPFIFHFLFFPSCHLWLNLIIQVFF